MQLNSNSDTGKVINYVKQEQEKLLNTNTHTYQLGAPHSYYDSNKKIIVMIKTTSQRW